jgi:hypothetical protein
VIHANGQRGSNQKSARSLTTAVISKLLVVV